MARYRIVQIGDKFFIKEKWCFLWWWARDAYFFRVKFTSKESARFTINYWLKEEKDGKSPKIVDEI